MLTYLLLGVWTSQSGLWSRFTMPKHRGQKTWTGKTFKPNSMCEQGSVSLRRSRRVCAPSWIAHHFWLAAATTSCPPYRRTCLGVVNIITEYGTLPSCCAFSSPLDPFILSYPQPQRCAILFLFTYSSVQHTLSAIVLYGRKPATRVHSCTILLFREMLYLFSAIAVIHHANTEENCQTAPQLLHPTAQGTSPRPADSTKKSLKSVVVKIKK